MQKLHQRRVEYDREFQQTLKNFTSNMNFLDQQSQTIKDLVTNNQKRIGNVVSGLTGMNSNLSVLEENLNTIEQMIIEIKKKQDAWS